MATHQVFNTSQTLSEAHNKSRGAALHMTPLTQRLRNHNHDLLWLHLNESFLQDEKSLGLNLDRPQGQLSLSDSFIFSVLPLVNHRFYHLHFICTLFQNLYVKWLYINNSLMTSPCCHDMCRSHNFVFFSSQHPNSWQRSTVMNEVYEMCAIKISGEDQHCTTHEYAVTTVLLTASSFY